MRLRPLAPRSWRRVLCAGLAAAVLSLGAAAQTTRGPGPVKDPHYGDGLFHFFQDRYFSALSTLMVSQHFERMPQHADEAEILRGGLLLSYGLHREAGRIFDTLIEQGARPAVRDRAWYYLAKIRYQRGHLDQAQAALDRIGSELPAEFHEDHALLRAQVLMARGHYAQAAALLRAQVEESRAQARRNDPEPAMRAAYARYNLGVALIRNHEVEAGTPWLDEIGKAGAHSEEYRVLRDRANVALGLAALQAEQPRQARQYLERVRLHGPQSNQALLGFGWAAAALDQPREALVPWMELAGRESDDAAVLEARIAVPHAQAELGAFGLALQGYQDAIAAYEREHVALDESIAAIRAGKLVEGLMSLNPGVEMGWFWQLRELPQMPHGRHLARVLARHEFQEAFKNYRDLQFLAHQLAQWRDKLAAFRDILEHRQQAFADRLPRIRAAARESETGVAALARRREAAQAELERVIAQRDAAALATPKERQLLERLARVRETLARVGDAPEAAPLRERHRLAEGVLRWRLDEDYPVRLWEARKAQRSVDEQLAQAQAREAALAQAQRDEPARFATFEGRIPALGGRIEALAPRVAELTREQQQAVEALAVAELTRQQQRLAVYATQARFAVAQLYDHATRAAGGAQERSDAAPR